MLPHATCTIPPPSHPWYKTLVSSKQTSVCHSWSWYIHFIDHMQNCGWHHCAYSRISLLACCLHTASYKLYCIGIILYAMYLELANDGKRLTMKNIDEIGVYLPQTPEKWYFPTDIFRGKYYRTYDKIPVWLIVWCKMLLSVALAAE